MKTSLLFVVPFLFATQFAFASGEPASVDCFANGNEISFGTDSSSDKATDDLLVSASFYSNAKEGKKNKDKSSGAKYVGQLADAKGDRSDETITVSYKDAKGNTLTVHGDNGTNVKKQDSIYSIRYGATITVKLKSVDGTGSQAELASFPSGRLSGVCLYNPGS